MLRVCALLPLLVLVGCSQRQGATCSDNNGEMRSPLAQAPKNGAQRGGMTIGTGGVSEGSGAPKAAADNGYGVLRIYVVLSAPGAGLTGAQQSALADTLDDCRNRGVQAFPRFYYENAVTSKANAADTAQKIASDIAAAKPVLTPRLDVIPFIQAGFLGPWGEWWSGDLEGADLGTDQSLRTLKTGVVNRSRAPFRAPSFS